MPELLKYDSPITLVELRPRSFGRLDRAELPDTYGTAKYPPRALPILHAVAQKAGFTNVKSIAPAFNTGGKITAEDWVRVRQQGVIGVSAVSRTVDVSLEFLRRVKETNPDVLTVIGGYHASFDQNYCLERGADVVVIGEGETTFSDFLTNLATKGTYEGTPGIAYKKENEIVQEKKRPQLTREQLSQLPLPVYDELVLKGWNSCTMWSARGCPNDCTFCSVAAFNGGKYRRRSNESIIEEWKTLPYNKRMFWVDDEFAADIVRMKELLEAKIRLNLPHPLGTVQVPAGIAEDREAVKLLKKAGCTAVCIGFEDNKEDGLREMGKKATVDDNERAAIVFRKEGIPILGMFILGMDVDTPERAQKRVEWAIKNVTWAQFSPRLPLVGTKDTAMLSANGRILAEKYGISPKYYLYDGYHVLFEPNHFTALDLQETVPDAYKKFYALRDMHWDRTDIKYRLYAKYAIPRIVNDPQTVEHRRFLESIEPPKVHPSVNIPK